MVDCLLIGGGVVGLSLAFELAGHGLRVRLLERGRPGREASWAGAGLLPPAVRRADDPPLEQLAGLSHELHPRWAAELRELTGIDTGYRRTGAVYLARTTAASEELKRQFAWWKSRGLRAEMLSSRTLHELEPDLDVEDPTAVPFAACLMPEESQLRNPRHLKALETACALRGVEISAGMAVEEFEIDGDRVRGVVTCQGVLTAESVCITAGSWSGTLARRLGLAHEAPIEPVRGQMVLLTTPVPVLRHIINEGPRYLVPRGDGRVLVGSTVEQAGFDCRTTAAGISGLLEFAVALAPGLGNATVEQSWAGLRPATADGLPYLGRMPGLENLFVAAGHFRSGLQLSPATAVVMGQLIRGLSPEISLAPFRIDRPQ
jgi:glycine oxidase